MTSEAGKKLYAGLLELAPAFDLLYDAAEAFQGWIDPASNATASMERLEGVFADLGLTMPETGAALMELYRSGELTTEQMALLGASLEDLKAVYDPMIAQEKALAAARQDLALLTLELEQGPEAALAERRRLELLAMDESLRPMQERIWALQDEAEAAAKLAEALSKAKDLMDDASIRIADLQDPEGAQQRARERELAEALKGQTGETADELRRLYESLWQLEDAATAAAKAAEAMAAAQKLMDDANIRIADLMDPAGAQQRARQRDLAEALKGQTGETADELRQLYESLWRLEDAATAAASAAEALSRAQGITRDLRGRIADVMDPSGATQRARQRELATAIEGQSQVTAGELRTLYEGLWRLEDAAAAAAAAAEALARAQEQKADLELRYLELTGSEAEILAARRAQERAETEQTNWALLDLIYAREDEVAAMQKQQAILAEREGLMIRLAEASGNSAEATRLKREMELRDALDDGNRAILQQIYVLEDARVAMEAAIASEYEARIASIGAQEEAARAAHDASMARLNEQRDAAQEALTLAEGLLSTIQSALDGMRGQQAFDDLTHARAAKQLAAWAKANTLPDVDKLSRVLDILAKADKQEFATAQEYRLAQASTFANLLALEAKAEKEVNWAEKQVQAIEAQIDSLNNLNDSTQAGFQAMREQADAWRDAQLAGICKH